MSPDTKEAESRHSGRFVEALARLRLHEHLCLIYETREEQFAAVMPFMRLGLERGEKCVYVADENSCDAVIAAMGAEGIDTGAALKSGALAVITKKDAYLRRGYFDPDLMIRFLAEAVTTAKEEGFTALRVTGEMTWALAGETGSERLLEYEAKLNRFLPDNDALAICQYNRARFSPEVIRDIILTHPLVIHGEQVCRNHYYVPPDDFLAPGQVSREVERLLRNIRKREVEEEDLIRSIVQSSDDAIIGKDPAGNILSWNRGAERIYGYSAEEAVGRPIAMLIPPGRDDDLAEIMARLRRGERVEHYETERMRKDGQLIEVSLTISPLINAEGLITGASVIARDVTEQKRTERVNSARLRLLQGAATHTLDELLQATLDEAEALTGSVSGFYHFLEADQNTLSLQNWSTRTKAEFCTAEGKGLHYPVSLAGVWVDCIHERRPVIHNDYPSLPHRKGLPPGHAPVYRELVVPVFRGGSIVAILGVGNKPWDYVDDDVAVVSLLADLAWEVAERKRAEEALLRLNRELRAVSNCNQVLMKATDEPALLAEICRIVCDEAGYRMAWVGYAENDDAKSVRPAAWGGVEEGYLSSANITWADTVQGRDPIGTAIRGGTSTWVRDFGTDPKVAPWRESALQRGYQSCIALPLKDEGGSTFGALTIYSTEPNAFAATEEVRLLEELAGDLAFGVNVLRARNAHRDAQRSIALLSFALDNVREAAFLVDEAARFRYMNEESRRKLKYTREELLGLGVADIDPDFPAERWPGHWADLKTHRSLTFEGRHRAKDGTLFPVEINSNYLEYDGQGYILALVRDITERKAAEQERLAHLNFLSSMDMINRAIQGTNDIEGMMRDALDAVLSIFDCDRAYLMYPCDPEAESWVIPMERTTPDYPGSLAQGVDLSKDAGVAGKLSLLLSSDGPVNMGPGMPFMLSGATAERFGIRSMMAMAIYPKVGKPWEFGIHQCSHARVWNPEEERLFKEIGWRLADGLTSLLAHRELRESEERYRLVFENSPVSIGEEDYSAVKALFEGLRKGGVADIEAHFDQCPEAVRRCAELVKFVDVNRAALVLHGAASKEELLSRMTETFTPETLAVFRQGLVHLWNGETEMVGDAAVKTLAGDLRHVTVYFSVCPGYEQTLSRVLVSLVDITSRKRVENTLRFLAQLGWTESSEGFLTSLARYLGEALRVDYVLIDRLSQTPGVAETAALYARGEIMPNMVYPLKGTPCESVVGKRLCYYPHGVQALFPEDKLLAEMGVVSYAGIPLWDQSGRGIGLVAVMDSKPLQDEEGVTQMLQLVAVSAAAFLERCERDLLLRQREQEYRTLVDNLPDCLARFDADGRYIFVNDAVTKTFAAPRDHFIGKTLSEFGAPAKEHGNMLLEGKIRQAFENALPNRLEAEWQTRDGARFYDILHIPERDEFGRVVSVLGIAHDITERKQAEEELHRLKDELEQRVRERTAELEVKNQELARLNKVFIGRELRMAELKERIRELEEKLGGTT